MSAWHLHLALDLDCETANEKLVVIILTDWAGADAVGRIDIFTLAESSCLSVGQARYYLQQAIKHGHVKILEKGIWLPYTEAEGFSYRVHLTKGASDD